MNTFNIFFWQMHHVFRVRRFNTERRTVVYHSCISTTLTKLSITEGIEVLHVRGVHIIIKRHTGSIASATSRSSEVDDLKTWMFYTAVMEHQKRRECSTCSMVWSKIIQI